MVQPKKKNESMKTTELSLFPRHPTGYSETDHRDSGSRLRNAVSRAGCLLWMVVTSQVGADHSVCDHVRFSGSYFCPSFCGWASNSVTETVAPAGKLVPE